MFYSVLFPNYDQYKDAKNENVISKPYFNDLGLNLIFNPIIKSKKEFELEKYYYKSLQDIEIISYRQEVMSELENLTLRSIMTEFSDDVYSIKLNMNEVRKALSSDDQWSNNYLMRGHMLDYAERYCNSVTKLKEELSNTEIISDGILAFKRYVNDYVETERYQSLTLAITKLREEFSEIEYTMLIDGGTIKIRKYEDQIDYSKKIVTTFEKFRQKDAEDYRHKLSEKPEADHVEVGVLDVLSKLYKDTFNNLSDFCSEYINFDDETIIRFSQDLQFYISWLDYIEPLKDSGLNFNYPTMEKTSDCLNANDSFDLALASKIKDKVVSNDFRIQAPESIVVITGPNQGGKTTYAKAFGQMHYLASLGVSVPGTSSSLYLFDNIYTHFGREEDLSSHDGKLKDDLERLHEITTNATSRSLIIINEIFSSTTMNDAVFLGNHMIDKLVEIKSPTVIVSFLDELALHSKNVVSMMSMVEDNNPMKRTYRVIRKAPDGSAYAIHIASRHNLTYEKLLRRLKK